eukprot:CAMPEP_0184689586 /NCGR_PEP_ID=MMETSP0312-20130426/30738_1 /TAXON_ID=31354 /ORGANISM="Compsopogon coeruleus, Strain SAG 36.94" /LENGTH=77 /DNA_ID=CAMNT_0027146955 /DNA_START=926 /DNA_END=1159 /DNA_ORIENTATION=+
MNDKGNLLDHSIRELISGQKTKIKLVQLLYDCLTLSKLYLLALPPLSSTALNWKAQSFREGNDVSSEHQTQFSVRRN